MAFEEKLQVSGVWALLARTVVLLLESLEREFQSLYVLLLGGGELPSLFELASLVGSLYGLVEKVRHVESSFGGLQSSEGLALSSHLFRLIVQIHYITCCG